MEDDELSSGIQMANAYAVIIGIGKYKDPTIPTLKYTHVDANDLYDVLTNPRRIGIQKENIKLLLNEDATLQNIKSTVGTWLLRKADEDSTVIIFFSGHGGVEPDPSGSQAKYLLPWDAWRDDLYATAISSRDFEGLLQRIKSNRLVMFLDACHSGGVISREGTKDVVTIENLCADLSAGSGRAIIAASQGSQQSFEDDKLGHGIFAHHLLEALKGKADTDGDGKTTLTETFNYLGREVSKTARELAGAVQEPMMRSDLTKDIVLAIDLDRLEEIRKEKEQAEQEAKTREEKGKLLRWWSERKLSTEQYDKALKVYEADDALLDEQDRRIKELTHELLAEKLAIENYVLSVNIILGTAEKSAAPKAAEKAAMEKTIAEEAKKTQEAAEHKAREEAEAKEKARREVEKKPAQAEKPAPVIKKIVRKGWFRAVVSVLLVVSIGVAAVLLFGPAPAPIVTFRDANLETVIRSEIRKTAGSITTADLESIYVAEAAGKGITDLTGLQYCSNLVKITLQQNQISDISQLASLTSIEGLYLGDNQISDISPLLKNSGLGTGDKVDLRGNPLSQSSINSYIPQLEARGVEVNFTPPTPAPALAPAPVPAPAPAPAVIVSIPDTNLQAVIRSTIGKPTGDITKVDLESVYYLDAGHKGITDLTGLQYCSNLKEIALSDSGISDISSLASLTNLNKLYLDYNQISDTSPLASLTNLNKLYLNNNDISDIAPLLENSGLSMGDRVDLTVNPLSQTSIDNYIPQLQARGIEVTFTPPTTSPIIVTFPDANLEAAIRETIGKPSGGITISDMKDIIQFSAPNDPGIPSKGISDLTGLQFCTRLQTLWLWGNQISDIKPLAELTGLTTLNLAVNYVNDISPLAPLLNLTTLDIMFNQISDISALYNLTSLNVLYLRMNKIRDISVLSNLTNLNELYLGNNQISDISPLENLTSLTDLGLPYNQISDILPLVNNSGLGTGDNVDLSDNPLSETSKNTYIPQLKARGVEVTY